jgi:class 3 adenylate cyclase
LLKGGPKVDTASLPLKEFRDDCIAWGLIGLILAGFYLIHYQATLPSALKVVLGSACFGLFGGMFSFLVMERHIIDVSSRTRRENVFNPARFIPFSRKMLFLFLSVLLFMVTAIILMVFIDINYLIEHPEKPDPDIFMSIFKEILFAFSVMMGGGIVLITYYSRNLKTIISMQLEVLAQITRGHYHDLVPVVTNDEFAIIATKTNEMIKGLRERDFCRNAFDRYMGAEVSRKILREDLPKQGERRIVTILFCDLRGYTTFAEGRDPSEVVAMLNEYFSEMESAIRAQKGIVLQYIGDEIEAVFGAPMDLPDHPDRAVGAALEMRKRLMELNRRRDSAGLPPIRHGIGIHTGEVFAGSVGSKDRVIYAMVGDTVNTASRIQTLNKQYGTDILLSERTWELLSRRHTGISPLGGALLRGKREEIRIFKVEEEE